MFVKVLVPWVLLAAAASAFEFDVDKAADEAIIRRFEVKGLAGESVKLPCEVDQALCGEFHSIKWYKGNDRVFIFSDKANVRRAEGPLLDRTDFHYLNNTPGSTLEIFPLRTEDEGLYKCELTYLNMKDDCSVVQFVNLTTHALPTYLQMSFEDGSPVENGTRVGPFDEATVLTLTCESGGGKPVASVTWNNGSQPIAGEYSSILEEDGTGTGRNVLRLPLTRADLGSTLTCKAVNDAMTIPYSAFVHVDVNVPPLSVVVSGSESPLHESDDVTLECVARGARPAASITWLNGSVPVQEAETDVNMENDNTFESKSRLQFKATRFENERTFTCEATNVVLENRNQKPMRKEVTLDVRYAPIVKVSPENITVNESMDVLIFCQYSANPSQLTHVNWYQDLRQVDVAGQPDKYANGNVDHPTLLIKNSSAADMGEYTCRVSNEVGASLVVNSAYVSVMYRPQVQVIMNRTEPVSEEDRVNVNLICDPVKANPEELLRVRWYLQGELLKELPECDGNASMYDSNSELCDIDPSRMLLENVFKDFHGNYSCEGMNEAGWGLRSADAELVVHYAPGPATINYHPPMVVKGKSLELTCNVEDPGRPAARAFRWYRGSHLVPDVTTATWTINPVSLETEDNFTCVPVNVEGEGERATVDIDVLAAPVFIIRLPPYYGALMSSKKVSLSCRVECSPLCSITWLKNDQPLSNNTYYTITSRVMPPDPSSGDLESVSSELTWRMDRWPGGMLDRDQDNANYTCTSTSNVAGPGVISHTYFRVEYPPEDIVVSETYLQVVEGDIPPKVICNASSYPEPRYVWQHGGQTVSTGAVLNMDFAIKRSKAGDYQCIAENRHGEMKAATTFDVQFKPECKIDREDGGSGEDAHILLICRAAANPEEVAFRWRLLNETLTQDITSEGLESRLRLPATSESLGTYYCYVNNTLGESIPCEIDVTEKLADDNVIVISAIVAAVIVLVIIICVVIIVICRRQRHAGKYPEGNKPPPTGHKDNGVPSSPDDDANKQTFYENLPFHGMQPPPNKDAPDNSGTASTAMGSRPPSQLSQQASSGYGSTRSRKDDVTLIQPSSEESSKVAGGRGSSPQGEAARTSVRRQNSDSYGSMRSTSGRPAKGPLARTAAYLSMRLPGAKKRARAKLAEDSHQMIETQPVVKTVATRESQSQDQIQCPSRPPQTTQFTSETRHTVTSRPDLTVTVEASQTSRLTVLASPQADAEANNNSIYYDGVPRPGAPTHGTGSERFPDPRTYDPAGTGLPVPAPRNGSSSRTRHTYQNLPSPAPATDGGTSVHQASPPPPPQPVVCENRKTGSYGSAQNPTPSSSSSSSSPSSSHYPAQYPSQYPPQYQRNPSLYKQYPSSTSLKETHPSAPYNKSSSRQSFSSSTYPHRMENQSHPPASYPNATHSHTATSYPNSQSHAYPQPVNSQGHPPKYPPGVVYADLALSRNGQPNHYRRDLNTEYAILQFNGPVVGQEIDV